MIYPLEKIIIDIQELANKNSKLRKNAPEIEGSTLDMNDLSTWLRPAAHVHVGMTSAVPNYLVLVKHFRPKPRCSSQTHSAAIT